MKETMDRASRHELHTTQARVTGTARRTGWTENELRFLAILDFSSGMGRIPLFCKFRAEPSSGRCINPPLFILHSFFRLTPSRVQFMP